MRRIAVLVVVAACSNPSTHEDKPKPAPRVHVDAGAPPGITQIHGYDPASGLHLDEGGERHATEAPAHTRPARPIDVTLRSTPPGAQVAVDGVVVGTTPAFWPGEADGREHEFTFVLAGHATARYRFVPVTSGVIHARLEPVAEEPGAGAPDQAPEGSPVPGAGSALVNPPPAPVQPRDAWTPDAAAVAPPAEGSGSAPVTPTSPVGPQP